MRPGHVLKHILTLSVLWVASCTAETAAPTAQSPATPIPEPSKETAGEATQGATAAPTQTAGEDVTPTFAPATATNTPEAGDPGLLARLPQAIMERDYQALEAMMGDPFVIDYWEDESQEMAPAEAMERLRQELFPEPLSLRFANHQSFFPELGDFDPAKAFGLRVKVVELIYSVGWGADGKGEAILAVGLSVDGQYWPGMIYAPAGFEEPFEAGSWERGRLTYVNEDGGYAFDYPAGWIVSGNPAPASYMYAITVKNFKPGLGGTGTVPPDKVKLDFVTCNSAECSTLQQIQAQIDEQVAAGTLEIVSEEHWTLAGGVAAIRRRAIGEMGIETSSLVTEIDGKVLRIGGYGDLDAVDEVLRTLRPAYLQPAENGLRAVLEIPPSLPAGEAVRLQFHLVNDSESNLYLLNWLTPLEDLGGEIFRVKRNGVIVPYQGIVASRGDPTPNAYTMLEAGEWISLEVDLSAAYDLSTAGSYTIEFLSPSASHVTRLEEEMAKTQDELGPVEIPANGATVEIEPRGDPSDESVAAQEALVRYFSLLSMGEYADAVELHGAGYEALRDWNPTADPGDLAGLLEQGCTVNGLVCRPLKTISLQGTSAPGAFEFTVQFENPDGSLFVLNPDGEWPGTEFPRSLFSYTVVRTADGHLVQELPVSVP